MLASTSIVLALCWMAHAAVVPEARRYNLPSSEADEARAQQLFYLQSIAYPNQIPPQLQRLELSANPDAQYFNQERQDVQAQSDENTSKDSEAPAKLENLEPDAELIPGAQQNPQSPPTQVPVSPPSGIPGLLPGQRFYIVHPQHQIYNQNPLYPGLPNGFRPNVQVPGFQRFYIVPAQPGVGDGNFVAQAGYQTAILVDPSGQSYATPQALQPISYQRLMAPQAPQQQKVPEPNRNYQEAAKNYDAEPNQAYQQPAKNYVDTIRGYQEPARSYAEPIRGYQGVPQPGQFVGAQPQFGPVFTGAQAAALPYFGFGRQVELPYQQQGLKDELQNAIRFSQLISLNPGQFSNAQFQGQGQVQALSPAAPAPPANAQAQGRKDERDDEYSDEESKKEEMSTESNSFDEIIKKSDGKSMESAPEEPKSAEDTKEAIDMDKTASPKAAANIQAITKRS